MKKEVKKSYENIKMSQESKRRIYEHIMESKDVDGERSKIRGRRKWVISSGWKVGLAACLSLVLFVPVGVYAAGKISEYFTVSIQKDNYQAKINLNKPENTAEVSDSPDAVSDMKYIQVSGDYGADYSLEKEVYYIGDGEAEVVEVVDDREEGSDGMYSYSHKDGYEAGKDFYYDVIYMDEAADVILNLYNQSYMKEVTINGHKALLCQSDKVQGSRYASEYKSDYSIDLYVFYEEYGYIIDFGGMQGLGKKALMEMAEKTTVTETTRDKASRYIYLSLYHKGNTEQSIQEKRTEVTHPVKAVKEDVKVGEFVYQVTDVSVTSKVKDTNRSRFTSNTGKLWNERGNLIPYSREKIKVGDGISQLSRSVAGTEKIQPKMIYVTMKVKSTGEDIFELPDIVFFDKEGEKYYDTDVYVMYYNRPEKIEDALMDYMPCYFKETEGGKGFWLKDMKAGEEQVYHFAYIVDGDMTDKMFLRFDEGNMETDSMRYVDISQ